MWFFFVFSGNSDMPYNWHLLSACLRAEIREEVQKVKEESKIHAGVKKVNETPSEETKIHEGVKKLKEDSSSDENAKKEARASAREEDEEAAEEVVDEKTKTLRAALAHVVWSFSSPFCGFHSLPFFNASSSSARLQG